MLCLLGVQYQAEWTALCSAASCFPVTPQAVHLECRGIVCQLMLQQALCLLATQDYSVVKCTVYFVSLASKSRMNLLCAICDCVHNGIDGNKEVWTVNW